MQHRRNWLGAGQLYKNIATYGKLFIARVYLRCFMLSNIVVSHYFSVALVTCMTLMASVTIFLQYCMPENLVILGDSLKYISRNCHRVATRDNSYALQPMSGSYHGIMRRSILVRGVCCMLILAPLPFVRKTTELHFLPFLTLQKFLRRRSD